MTDIKQPDWDSAPEDATHWEYFGCNGRNGFWIKDWDVATGKHSFLNASGPWMLGTYASDCPDPTKRPTKSLVYTQAMRDEGEPPLAGMECEIRNGSITHRGIIKYISNSHVIAELTSPNYEQHFYAKGLKFRPIDTRTDKEKAIDSVYRSDLSVKENLKNAYDEWVK